MPPRPPSLRPRSSPRCLFLPSLRHVAAAAAIRRGLQTETLGTVPAASSSPSRRRRRSTPAQPPQAPPSILSPCFALRKHLDALPPTANLENTALLAARMAELRSRDKIPQRTPDWHAARRALITASEVTAFLQQDRRALDDYYADFGVPLELRHYDPGAPLSPFKSSELVLEEKTAVKRRRETPAMRWGTRFEPIALEIYSRLYARTVEPFGLLTHDGAHPWLGASVDGIEHDTGMVVEVKCPMRPVSETWGPDDLPEPHYWVQVQIQLEVLALPAAWLYTSHFVEYADAYDFLSDPITPRLSGCMLIPISNRKPRAIKPSARNPHPLPPPPPLSVIYPPPDLLVLDNSYADYEAVAARRAQLLAWVEQTCDPHTHRAQFWYLDRTSRKWVGRSQRWFARVAGLLIKAHRELEAVEPEQITASVAGDGSM
ncbi:hypothetical protein HDU86_000622 [Geranomyces michiganensis]|nr:hypothetical protein HDU86_000622 [Geranomyces michiganensis]